MGMTGGGLKGARGRRLIAVLAAGLLALGAAGCGDNDDLAPEVPGPPADIVIPESAEAPTDAANQDQTTTDDTGGATSDDTGGATTDDTGGATTDDTGGATTDDTGTTAPEEATPAPDETGTTTTPDASTGGTAAPDGEADGPTNDTPPPEGSDAQEFEDFCAQNPGAC
jgi:hypothetical protein